MNDDLTTLASSYLDGTVTADERAFVEADDELRAEVERLRQVRAVLGDNEPAPISVRERHLAAALDAWDRLPAPDRTGVLDATPAGADAAAVAGAASVTAPVSLADRRRFRRSNRMLAIAAGLVLVLGGGLIARSALRTSDSGGSDASSAAVEEQDEASAQAGLDVLAAEETFGAEPVEAPSATLSVAADASQGDALIGSDEAPPEDDLTVLRSGDDLAVLADLFVRTAAAESADIAQDGELEPPFDTCGLVDRIVGPALWDSEGLFDTPVVVGIDDELGEAIAYDEETCTVVARSPLLTP
ncbi:MAG: hypothetical protein HKN44_09505 [Ilumatobacter sp.]|nr:hypothetical protein [Ilumatobacter sp.]